MRRRNCALTALAFVLSMSAAAMPVSVRDLAEAPEDGRPAVEAAWWSVVADGQRHASLSADPIDAGNDGLGADQDGLRSSALVLSLLQVKRKSTPAGAASLDMLQRSDDEAVEPEQAASSVSRSAYVDPSNRLFGEGLVGLVGAERHNAALAEARQWFAAARDVVSMDSAARPVDPAAATQPGGARPEVARERLIPAAVVEFVRSNKQWLLVGIIGALVLALVVEAMRPRRRGPSVAHRQRLESERRVLPERRARVGEHHRERHREGHGDRRGHVSRRERGERRAAQVAAR